MYLNKKRTKVKVKTNEKEANINKENNKMDPYGRYPGYGYGAGYPVGGSQFQEVREEIRDEIVQTNNGYGPFGGGSQFVEERVIEVI